MFRKIILFVCFVLICLECRAQTADEVYNQYLDFNLARLQGENDKVLNLGEKIIPNADKLPEKARISFYFSAGKMYEDNKQLDKAQPYYERVAAAVPDYYVVHRALGYLYLEGAKHLEQAMKAAPDKATRETLMEAYEKAARKALPHLEKAQACDPDDQTLALIKMLYKNIKDTAAINSLDSRLKELNQHCIDILQDH